MDSEDWELYDEPEEPPDYYVCMCCGATAFDPIACPRCCGPMNSEWF